MGTPPATLHPGVLAMAREGEPERYLAATLAPEPQRSGLIALAAFAADLRRIPTIVKEPMMGEVRLQWWRDAITAFDKTETTGHPLADALGAATRAHTLPPLSLIAMTEARAFDLYDDPMPDEAALAGYLAKTEAIPFGLAQTILGGSAAPLLSDLGARSFGYARMLAGLPVALSEGRIPLPLVMLKQHGVDPDTVLAGQAEPGVRAMLQQACREIDTTHAALRKAWQMAVPADRLALLPVATVPSLTAAIVAAKRDPLRTIAEISPLTRVMRIGRARWLGL